MKPAAILGDAAERRSHASGRDSRRDGIWRLRRGKMTRTVKRRRER
jgi:hypothetical protein